jgi:hypothetical protein
MIEAHLWIKTIGVTVRNFRKRTLERGRREERERERRKERVVISAHGN